MSGLAAAHSINSESEGAFEDEATRSLLHAGSHPIAERAAQRSGEQQSTSRSFLLGALVALLVSLIVLVSVVTHGWLAWQWTHPADAQQPQQPQQPLAQLSPAAPVAAAGANVVTPEHVEAVSAESSSGIGVQRAANGWATGRVAPSAAGRYLFFIPAAGYSNQVHGFIKAMTVANAFNRTLVVPPLLSNHIVGQHSWFDKRSENNATLRIHVKQHKLWYYEQLSRYTSVNASVLATRDWVLASDLIKWRGANMDCWAWPSKTQVYGVGDYVDTNATVLCIGITHGMPPILQHDQPQLHFDTRMRDWLLLDDEIVRDSRLWLHYAAVDAANYSCLHFRGGDFKQFAGRNYVNVSGLARFVNQSVGIQRHTVLITNTDDAEDRAELSRLPWRELTLDSVHTLEPVDRLRDIKKLHMDMHICAQASTFVGCERSSMSRLIRTARDCAAHTPGCLDYCEYDYRGYG